MSLPTAIGSLFTGIGGLDIGLEQAGVGRVAWACESDPFCRAVLERHWPGVPVHDDVRTLDPAAMRPVEVICGGFPCQDLSLAGTGAGLDGARSGLFFELLRVVRVVRPLVVVLENVAALVVRGLDRVLGELAALGYDAWWDCIPAYAVGAPHRRDRIFIVAWLADAASQGLPVGQDLGGDGREELEAAVRGGSARGGAEPRLGGGPDGVLPWMDGRSPAVSRVAAPRGWPAWPVGQGEDQPTWEPARTRLRRPGDRMRNRALGNAVVPQVAEHVGRKIVVPLLSVLRRKP